MDQRVKQHRFLKYLWLLNTPIKLAKSFIKARIRIWIRSQMSKSRSDQKGPDLTKKVRIRLDPDPDPPGYGSGSGSATLTLGYWQGKYLNSTNT
jgi:hypothetical protein